jgi:hypothetical protein
MLWLSTAIVDAANRGRPNSSGVKVGGDDPHVDAAAGGCGAEADLLPAHGDCADGAGAASHPRRLTAVTSHVLGKTCLPSDANHL